MLRKILSTLSIVLASAGLIIAQNESAIKVKLSDKAKKETIPFANVIVEMGGIQVGVGTTNIDGEVTIKPLNPGKYSVKATYVGYQTMQISDVNLAVGKTVYLNLEMTSGQQLAIVDVVIYQAPLVDPDTKSGQTVTRDEYQHMASKDINSVAATTAGVYQNSDGKLNMRGARDGGTAYYVDGQKVVSTYAGSADVPQSSIEQVTTIIGGTPAEYGDVTGGIIAITTRGPSSKYAGSVEFISSGLGEKNQQSRGLDAYGYNFAGFSINGPLLTNKDTVNKVKKSVLGFSLSGEAYTNQDPNPSANGFYQVNPTKLSQLEQTPLRPNPNGAGGYVLNSEYITASDLQKIKAKNNVRSNSFLLNGKIQYQPTTNLGITIGASADYVNQHYFVYDYALFNPTHNPQEIDNTYRVYAKLTQKFNDATAQEQEKSSSTIKNAYFTLQASYAKTKTIVQDDSHTDHFFDYGYVGKFTQTITPSYNFDPIKDAFYQSGNTNSKLTFTPSDINPLGAAYTEQFYAGRNPNSITGPNDVQAGLGLMNGDRPNNVYGLWYETGRAYGGYSSTEQSQFRVFATFSADIQKHAIQAGFEFEQRNLSSFSLTAIPLWTQMSQLANSHISQLQNQTALDTANAHLNTQMSGTIPYYDFARLNDGTQTQFDRSLRTALGYDKNSTNWIDVNSITPQQIESFGGLKMFSADDLLNANLVSYYGYDHTGAKTTGKTSIDDFFTKKDANGNFTRDIGAFQPIYVAGYIQDKFDFKDLKFNVGVRIDRYDANQSVLKDKYLLYDAKTAGEVNFGSEFNTTRPSNIGDNYVVYVDNKNAPTKVVGYRNGDTWYNAQGTQVTDPGTSLAGSNTVDGTINPYLLNPAAAAKNVISSSVFEGYTPQINVMPRIAFSFPISDVANFFAHYDVLTQRPADLSSRFDPIQYLQIQSNSQQLINNPNLKPERTTDYELGFTQVLNEKKNSALTLSTFYRELRNMTQVVQVIGAYPVTYNSYSNIDFGTVKGFSIAYDLRRTNGIQLTASYTLQFADGTGSSATDGVNLASAGLPNLRTTHPLDFDQRHTVVLNVDYRFFSGKEYKGPVWTYKKGGEEKTIKLLENMGANIVARAGSGTPYSRQINVTEGDPNSQNVAIGVAQRSNLTGMVNGSNLPWNFKIDMRIDKNIPLAWDKKEGEAKKHANLNVYLQVLNVLNAQNILKVYKATGNPGDDGFLASAAGITTIANANSPASFTDLYNIKVNDPSYLSQPRMIRLGLLFDF